MKVLIAGAGIGGLTAGLCFLRAGYDVEIFEKVEAFAEVGAGLQCGANALHVFNHLGLMDAIEAASVAPKRVEFRDYQSGDLLHSMTLGQSYAATYGAPYLHIHRADLHGILAREFGQGVANALHLGVGIESYQERDATVQAVLSNGETVEGDVLVGADGLHSAIRSQVLGDTKPIFTGNVAWRGVVPIERLPNDWMDTVATNFVGPNKHMVLYYLRQQRLANFVGVVENKNWQNDSWVAKAPWQELQADFAGWHPMVQGIIDAVDKDQCYRWALHKHQPFSNWSSKRVTLLGDAAHSTLPFMASGAAMAIEDARILERSLSQHQVVEQGLQCYQRNRLSRTARIQKESSQLGTLYHFNSRLMRKAAFSALKIVGSRKESFLPDYNANNIRLI